MKTNQPNKPDQKLVNLFFISLLSHYGWIIILIALAAVGVYTLIKPFVGEIASAIISGLLGVVTEYFILKKIA